MRTNAIQDRKVNLAQIKAFALEELPPGPLRDDIMSLPDEIPASEYLASCRVWLRLLRRG